MSKTLVRSGGESPSYEYLRTRFESICTEPAEKVQPYEVAVNGLYWQVTGGILNNPGRSSHGYGMIYRRVETETGTWYEAEMRNPVGTTIRKFGYAEEAGYSIEPDGLLSDVSAQQALVMLAMIDRTEFSDVMAYRAAFELTDSLQT